MRRVMVMIASVSLVAAGCSSTLGRTLPECDAGSATMVLAVQSVPTSHYVSCIQGLKAGWDFEDLEARSGQSHYLLDSDRMGQAFLRVENVEACEPGEATHEETDDRGVELWKDVDSEVDAKIALVPAGPTPETSKRAVELIGELDGLVMKGRPVVLMPSVTEGSTKERIDAAAADGAHVIAISIRDVEEGTLTVLPKGAETEISVDGVDEALELFEDAETEAFYVGSWFYVFEGGCVTYTFDAEGHGVATIEDDVEIGLSLFDAEAFRQIARDAGYLLP